jgi:rubrerythrin
MSGERILIPEEAVIRTGKREIVFVDMGEGKYAPREITAGVSGQGDVVEVRKGLFAGEIIVVSGQFMLDSESKTQEAIQKMIKAKMEASPQTEPPEHTGTPHITEEPETHEQAHGEVRNLNLTPDKKAHDADDVYTCPMDEHSHILQVGPGDCPECGMFLVPITETGRDVYTCPMEEHHHVLSNVPGRCPECGMQLAPLIRK